MSIDTDFPVILRLLGAKVPHLSLLFTAEDLLLFPGKPKRPCRPSDRKRCQKHCQTHLNGLCHLALESDDFEEPPLPIDFRISATICAATSVLSSLPD